PGVGLERLEADVGAVLGDLDDVLVLDDVVVVVEADGALGRVDLDVVQGVQEGGAVDVAVRLLDGRRQRLAPGVAGDVLLGDVAAGVLGPKGLDELLGDRVVAGDVRVGDGDETGRLALQLHQV